MNKFKPFRQFGVLLLLVFASYLGAGDAEATEFYAQAHEAYLAGKYYEAANLFTDAELAADSPTIRANSLKSRISAWRMCEMPYREFTDIETWLERYPEYADFNAMVEREFAIGDYYFGGGREPAFYHLRWIPFLDNGDKTAEIYRQAIKRSPYAESAPRAMLRLAILLDRDGETAESVELLRALVQNFPESSEYRYALLALADGLLILSEAGDGDGRYSREAFETLKTYRQKYSDTPQMEWVKLKQEEYFDLMAARELELADYYLSRDRRDAARRHLALVLSEYPDSRHAKTAEKQLIELTQDYLPGPFPAAEPEGPPKLRFYQIPAEASRILLAPGGKTHRLQPVPDLKGPDTVLITSPDDGGNL